MGNYQYVETVVNGKTGTRPLPLINSIPYLKDYLDHEHPQPRKLACNEVKDRFKTLLAVYYHVYL